MLCALCGLAHHVSHAAVDTQQQQRSAELHALRSLRLLWDQYDGELDGFAPLQLYYKARDGFQSYCVGILCHC